MAATKWRRPEFAPLLFLLGTELVLLWLGAWQIQRLGWKRELIGRLEQAQAAPELTSLPAEDGLEAMAFRRARLRGKFDPVREFHLLAKGKPGYFIWSPFVLEDGRVLLVNRGYVPPERKEAGAREAEAGSAVLSGVLRLPSGAPRWLPDHDLARNIWMWQDIGSMQAQLEQPVLPIVLEVVGERRPGFYPQPSDGKTALRNDHLGYAITWFALALLAPIMFTAYYREKVT